MCGSSHSAYRGPSAPRRQPPNNSQQHALHPLWPRFQTRRLRFLLVPLPEGGDGNHLPEHSDWLGFCFYSSPHWTEHCSRIAVSKKQTFYWLSLLLCSSAHCHWLIREEGRVKEGTMRYRSQGLVRPEVSAIKFLQGGRARGESWSGNLRRQWRDPGTKSARGADTGDSISPGELGHFFFLGDPLLYPGTPLRDPTSGLHLQSRPLRPPPRKSHLPTSGGSPNPNHIHIYCPQSYPVVSFPGSPTPQTCFQAPALVLPFPKPRLLETILR